MTEKRSPERPTPARDGGSEPSPMGRFTDLARQLVSVTPGEVAKQQEIYDAERGRKRRPRMADN